MTDTIVEMQNPPQLMNPRELAKCLGLCPDTIRRAAKAGAIPSLRAGGAVRFNSDHVAQITRDGFAWPKRKTN
jgi:excisionase family DNA binding protein